MADVCVGKENIYIYVYVYIMTAVSGVVVNVLRYDVFVCDVGCGVGSDVGRDVCMGFTS